MGDHDLNNHAHKWEEINKQARHLPFQQWAVGASTVPTESSLVQTLWLQLFHYNVQGRLLVFFNQFGTCGSS